MTSSLAIQRLWRIAKNGPSASSILRLCAGKPCSIASPKLSVVRVPVGFLLEPRNVRVLQEGVDLITCSGVLVSLEQHRVGVCWGLEVGFFINRVWVVDWVAGETVNDSVVDARPPDCCEAIQGQVFLQVDQAQGRQFVERLGVEDGERGRCSTTSSKSAPAR